MWTTSRSGFEGGATVLRLGPEWRGAIERLYPVEYWDELCFLEDHCGGRVEGAWRVEMWAAGRCLRPAIPSPHTGMVHATLFNWCSPPFVNAQVPQHGQFKGTALIWICKLKLSLITKVTSHTNVVLIISLKLDKTKLAIKHNLLFKKPLKDFRV